MWVQEVQSVFSLGTVHVVHTLLGLFQKAPRLPCSNPVLPITVAPKVNLVLDFWALEFRKYVYNLGTVVDN